jgi:transcriptional regulator with XRE-family HTH domain
MEKVLTGNQAVKVWLIHQEKSQRWLAGKLGVSDATLSKILTGRVSPSPLTLRRLQRVTGIDLTVYEQVA